ncbi:MAG: DUF3299 domain-containing protein [Rubrivivax sp.]|nr:DUF3299 domain-containing protein [Rubrivivax sp.]
MKLPVAVCLLVSLFLSLLPAAALAQKDGVPLMKPPLAAAAKPASAAAVPGAPRTITWDALVPAGWDPFKDFKDLNFQMLDDGDPRATAMLKKMRDVWDNAPVNETLVGQSVRIPGFIVPLEDSKDGMKEFLLVPYFGACIHSPPPPANQIVHVLPKSPAKGLRSMDAVWITGRLVTGRTDSYMGAASYRIEAVSVLPYTETPGK